MTSRTVHSVQGDGKPSCEASVPFTTVSVLAMTCFMSATLSMTASSSPARGYAQHPPPQPPEHIGDDGACLVAPAGERRGRALPAWAPATRVPEDEPAAPTYCLIWLMMLNIGR